MSDKKEVQVITKEVRDLAFPEITKMQMTDSFNQLVEVMPEHTQMLEVIKESLPEIQRATSLFFKTQSQFMDNMMTVSAFTPIRNARQILAEMVQTREAIKEATFKLKKEAIDMEMKQLEMDELLNKPLKTGIKGIFGKKESLTAREELQLRKLEIEIREMIAKEESTRGYISGAIRKLTNYTEQYNKILDTHGIHDFTEADFEAEEERYHIARAFEQALCAARSRQGVIDEGNMIYLTQIGINGGTAQKDLLEFLNMENQMLQNGLEPTHQMYLEFLHRMCEKYAGSAEAFAEAKGMTTISQIAFIQKGDTRMLDAALPAPQKSEEVSDESEE